MFYKVYHVMIGENYPLTNELSLTAAVAELDRIAEHDWSYCEQGRFYTELSPYIRIVGDNWSMLTFQVLPAWEDLELIKCTHCDNITKPGIGYNYHMCADCNAKAQF